MTAKDVVVARIYTMEGRDLLNPALGILRGEAIEGVTVLRGIAGIGASGEIHTSSLVDLSLDLPLIIEFYDEPAKVEKAIAALQANLGLKHVISWPASRHTADP